MKYANSIADLIGSTPLLKLQDISNSSGCEVFGKCEFLNPTSSIKDRIALNMIKKALESGEITKNSTIIEPTSGNTGIGLASICASMGIRLILTMPASMSVERRKLLSALGAELVLTPPELGMNGAVKRATELLLEHKNSYMPQQFENINNPQVHIETTAKEIWEDCDGSIDIFVAAIGTGGTITGVGEYLKQKNSNIKVIAVEPFDSPVLSGGKAAPHKIQGVGAGFVPKILNCSIFDEIIKVKNQEAYEASRKIAKNEGVIVGISAGANIFAALEMAKRERGKRIVTILCDTGERYLSTELYE